LNKPSHERDQAAGLVERAWNHYDTAKELRAMMGWYHDGTGWGGWLLMAVVMVAFWTLVALGVVALFRETRRMEAPETERPDPSRILDERFARGEIDEAEYLSRRGALRPAAPHHG